MIRAYDETCLESACNSLGRMLDYSVHSLHTDADSMMELFVASGIASLFGCGDMRTIAGRSGIELAYMVFEKSSLSYERIPARYTISFSNEYWSGYALAYAQWAIGLSFEELIERRPASSLIAKCSQERLALLESLPLDISEEERAAKLEDFGKDFVRKAAELIITETSKHSNETRLKKLRIKNGLSQSALAKASGVPLRTLQQYEQRQKDINKAHFEYIIMLSSTLNCEPSQLLERG